jgi:arsenite-transporting ATPase
LVVTPERMVIDEALRAHTDLSLFELRADAVVMNRLLPEAAGDEAFFADWVRIQAERRDEVAALFAPLPVLTAPLQDDEVSGISRLAAHGDVLFASHAPGDVLCDAPLVRFERDEEGYLAAVPLPHVDPGELDVAVVDDELVIRTAERRRVLKLPRRFSGLDVASARMVAGALEVRFQDGDAA